MMPEVYVEKLTFENKDYYVMTLGDGGHTSCLTVWVHPKFVQVKNDGENTYFVKFPVKGEIIKTKQGNYVLVPSENAVTYFVHVSCNGKWCESDFKVESPTPVRYEFECYDDYPLNESEMQGGPLDAPTKIYRFVFYRSPAGKEGIDAEALVVVKPAQPLKLVYSRCGDETDGELLLYPDGKYEMKKYEKQEQKPAE